jgi:type IV secretion system protein VirD4
MLSPLMRENLAKDDLDFRRLKEKPTTVYLILPAERMRTHSTWLRLVIISALRSLYTHDGLRTLFILDEFAQLGYLPAIEDAFGLVRGYGVQLWPILQDLTQLKMLYKDRWETFMANSGVVQGFSPNDMTTADWMSRRAGEDTAVANGYSVGDSQNPRGQGSSHNTSYQQLQRRVFLPQELIKIERGHGVIFSAGSEKSVTFYAPPYWKIDQIKDRAKPNPYYRSK